MAHDLNWVCAFLWSDQTPGFRETIWQSQFDCDSMPFGLSCFELKWHNERDMPHANLSSCCKQVHVCMCVIGCACVMGDGTFSLAADTNLAVLIAECRPAHLAAKCVFLAKEPNESRDSCNFHTKDTKHSDSCDTCDTSNACYIAALLQSMTGFIRKCHSNTFDLLLPLAIRSGKSAHKMFSCCAMKIW